MSGQSFHILFVCSGNICRSAMAEQLLRTRSVGSHLDVSSAGIVAMEGLPMPDEAAIMSRKYGGVPDAHRSRLLTRDDVASADLVLTATRAHRASVVRLLPGFSRRTFTIAEFARLAGALPDDDALADSAAVVDAARTLRGMVPPPEDPEDDDLEDPYRRPLETYEMVAARLDADINVIVGSLLSRSAEG